MNRLPMRASRADDIPASSGRDSGGKSAANALAVMASEAAAAANKRLIFITMLPRQG
ncbi:hypothetical protein D3C83_297240 [compost metagenome]